MSYKTYKGKNMRVKVDGNYVACATNCQLKVSANVTSLDTDHKDVDEANPAWEEQEVKTLGWSISVEALYSIAQSETTRMSSEALLDMVGKTVEVSFDLYNGTTYTAKKTGNAVCTDCSVSGQNGQNGSVSAEFKGTGELSSAAA